MSYIGNTSGNQNYVPAVDFFSGNGVTTAFTLSRPVASVAQVQAVISNVPQNPGDAFTVLNNTITFTSAPPSGTNNIYVYYTSPNTQIVQPGQGTVGSAQMVSGINFTAGTITFADASTITSHAAPQVTVYTSGSGTYTTPTGAKYLYIKMVGGGGGGSGAGNGGTQGGNGGNTTFGTSLLTCNGGAGGINNNAVGGVGGSASLGAASGLALTGGNGDSGATSGTGSNYSHGGMGGTSAFGGAGSGSGSTNVGAAGSAVANTGGGGGGGQGNAPNAFPGSGGGAGGYVEAYISSPSASYSYAVGSGGSNGTGGTNGTNGGSGGSGVIFVTAYF